MVQSAGEELYATMYRTSPRVAARYGIMLSSLRLEGTRQLTLVLAPRIALCLPLALLPVAPPPDDKIRVRARVRVAAGDRVTKWRKPSLVSETTMEEGKKRRSAAMFNF